MNSSLCKAGGEEGASLLVLMWLFVSFWFGVFCLFLVAWWLVFICFYFTKLVFSVLTVNGNGSSFTKQMVFGVVTAMDLLTFISRNEK